MKSFSTLLGLVTILALAASAVADDAAKPEARPADKSAIRFDAANFAIDRLPDGWRRRFFNTNLASTVELYTTDRKVSFRVIADVPNPRPGLTTEKIRQQTQTELADSSAQYTLVEKTPQTIHGLAGIRTTARTTTGGVSLVAVYWVYTCPFGTYQLITTGSADDEDRVRDEAEKIDAEFRLIDPDARPKPPQPKSYHSDRYGFRVSAIDPTFALATPEAREASFACSDFAAGNDDTYLTVLAVPMRGQVAEDRDLALAMLNRYQMSFEQATDVRPFKARDVTGISCTYSRVVGASRFYYRIRVLQSHGTGYFVCDWTGRPALIPGLVPLLDTVSFDAAGPKSAKPARSAAERDVDANVTNEIANALYARQKYRESAAFHQLAVQDGNHPIYLLNLLGDYTAAKQPADALAAVRAFGPRYYDNPAVLTRAADLEASDGSPAKAIELYNKLFDAKSTDVNALGRYVTVLKDAKRYDDAAATVDRFRSYADSPEAVEVGVYVEFDRSDYTRAIELLCDARLKYPHDATLGAMLANAFMAEDRPDDALTIVQSMLDAGNAPGWVYVVRGRAQMAMKNYRDAKSSFETAVAADAQDKIAKDWLKVASDYLGEADNSTIKTPIDAVPVPDSILHPPQAAATDSNAVYRTNVTAMSFDPEKPLRTTMYQTVEVTSPAGVEAYNAFHFTFDPSFERIYLNKLVVRDAFGKTVGNGSVDSSYVQDAPSGDMTSTEKVLTVPVPGLKVGETIEVVVTRENNAASDKIQYKRTRLVTARPADAVSLVLRGKLDKVRAVASPGLIRREIGDAWCWTVANPTPVKYETMSSESDTYMPTVDFADADATWAGVAGDYLRTIGDVLRPDPDAVELARTVTKGMSTDAQKIEAVLKYVQSGLTYQGIEFGLRGRVPNKVADVIRNRYGDCKDHALLLRQLLNAIGVPAELALVASGEPVQPATPSLDQFDHMIVFVPGNGGSGPGGTDRWFDCTDKYSDLTAGVPFGLANKRALVLDAEKPRLVSIPAYPDGSGFDITRDATITPDGDVVLHDVIRCTGYYAANFRSTLTPIEPADRGNRLREMFSSNGRYNVDLTSFNLDGVDQTAKPVVFDVHYTVRHRFGPAGDRLLVGSVPASFEEQMVALDPVQDRRTPFEYRFPAVNHTTVTMTLPAGYGVDGLAKPYAADTVVGSDKVEMSRTDDGRVRVEFTEHVTPGTHPASEYTALERQRETLVDTIQPSIVLKPVK